MTTNTLAAIRERADDGYELWFDAFDNCCQVDQQVYTDIAALLAIVDALTARAEAAEAALRVYELERDAYVSTQTVFDTVWDAIRIMRGEITGNYYMMGGSDAMLTAIEQAREEVRRLRAQQAADALANGDADAGNGGG